MTVNNIPVMNAEIVTGVSMCLLFVAFFGLWKAFAVWFNQAQDTFWMEENIYLGFGTLLLAHVTFNIPHVILTVMPKLRQMDKNLVDAAQDLGCTWMQAFWKVIIPEAKPALITGGVISTVTILGYSAMAGTIGGGGLGQIAITYGYQKYDDQIVWLCVALTILIVQILQEFGMYIARRTDRRAHS